MNIFAILRYIDLKVDYNFKYNLRIKVKTQAIVRLSEAPLKIIQLRVRFKL